MVCAQAASLLGMERSEGSPLESGKPTDTCCLLCAISVGQRMRCQGKFKALSSTARYGGHQPCYPCCLSFLNIRKRRNKTHRQSPVTGIISAQSQEAQSCPWEGAGEGGALAPHIWLLPHLRQGCRRNASAGRAMRFHRAHLWGVAEAKKALLGWQKTIHQLNTKKPKRILHREQTFAEEGDSTPRN